jgi:DNA-binding HxlR family transcriptional regulator
MGSVGGRPVIAQLNLFQGLSNSGGRDRPIAVAYEITDFGKTALSFLDALKTWAETHDI